MSLYELIETLSDQRLPKFNFTGKFFLSQTLYVEKINKKIVVRNTPY